MKLRTVFAGAAAAGALLSSTQLLLVTGASRAAGIPDAAFVLADAAVLAALGQAAFMPVLVLAARLCPPGVEASLFAALMSVLNGGSAAGGALGGALTSALGVGESVSGGSSDWSNLPLLVGLCSVLSLAPLPLLALVPENMGAREEEREEEESEGGGGGGGGSGGGGEGGGKGTTTATEATATKAGRTRRTKKDATAPSSPPLRRRSSSRTRSGAKM